jgi:hypothetical protein
LPEYFSSRARDVVALLHRGLVQTLRERLLHFLGQGLQLLRIAAPGSSQANS